MRAARGGAGRRRTGGESRDGAGPSRARQAWPREAIGCAPAMAMTTRSPGSPSRTTVTIRSQREKMSRRDRKESEGLEAEAAGVSLHDAFAGQGGANQLAVPEGRTSDSGGGTRAHPNLNFRSSI